MAHTPISPGGGRPLGVIPVHTPITLPGGITGIIPHQRNATLPDWWGLLNDGSNAQAGPGSVQYGDIRFPLSGAIAPGSKLAVAYGQVRVGGSALFCDWEGWVGSSAGVGAIALCEGEIEAIDSFIVNGSPWVAYSSTDINLTERHSFYTGATGQVNNPSMTAYGGGIFDGRDVTNFTNVAYVFWEIICPPFASSARFWWTFLPGGADAANNGTPNEWAADVRGLKIYDPRTGLTVYSRNPVLISRDMLKRFGRVPDSMFDDTVIAANATASDVAGFTCDIVFSAVTALRDAIANVLQTCNGTVVTTGAGKVGITLALPNAGD